MILALLALSACAFGVGIVIFFSDGEREFLPQRTMAIRYCFVAGSILALLVPVVSLFS